MEAKEVEGVRKGGVADVVEGNNSLDREAISLPLDSYLISFHEARIISKARIALIASCMRGFGYEYAPSESKGGPKTANERRYGLTDAAQAERQGYNMRISEPADPSVDEEKVLTGASSVARGKSVPEGGCYREADEKLGKGDEGSIGLAQKLNVKSYEMSMKTTQVARVFSQWSACMKERGFLYGNPLAPLNDEKFIGEKMTEKEKRTARLDVLCKEKVSLVSRWEAEEAKIQQQLIKVNMDALVSGKRKKDAYVENAEKLIP
ncbi:hypothetical protein ACFXJ6_07835 [Streptomyces sp. NPDC059218]|uniref:hypothetical protein n=1 Tax=unclassified Streptomyces TaxID=2593676 RepID=UPI0036BEF75F